MTAPFQFQRVSLIFPCFNEEGNLARFEREVFQFFDQEQVPFECVFVDDGSKDRTWSALQALFANRPHVRLARHPVNRGLGAAVRTGISAASGDAILTMDADLTFSPREALKLMRAYGPDTDCVIGSPQAGSFENVPAYRRFLSNGVNAVYQKLLGRPITATSSILRIYRADRLKTLDLTSDGFNINAEIVLKLLMKGARLTEVPVALTTRLHGVSKINTAREIKNHLLMFGRILLWKAKR